MPQTATIQCSKLTPHPPILIPQLGSPQIARIFNKFSTFSTARGQFRRGGKCPQIHHWPSPARQLGSFRNTAKFQSSGAFLRQSRKPLSIKNGNICLPVFQSATQFRFWWVPSRVPCKTAPRGGFQRSGLTSQDSGLSSLRRCLRVAKFQLLVIPRPAMRAGESLLRQVTTDSSLRSE